MTLMKKRNLPAMLETLAKVDVCPIPWLGHRRLVFAGATRTYLPACQLLTIRCDELPRKSLIN